MSDTIESLLRFAQGGDAHAFARLLTQIEQKGAAVAFHCDELLNPRHVAYRVGITGPPGAGKSTLIGELLRELNKKDLKVGVLAVDPTSPFSQGAILGDRIRYSEHLQGNRFFVRSLGTRGSLGGLSAAAYLMLRAFDACGFDLVLVETVGVGQVEVEIMNVADTVTVVLVPESGDSVQAMKAGILEIADIFVVNKSDRPGAESLKREIEASLVMNEVDAKKTEVLLVSALSGVGIADYMSRLLRLPSQSELIAHRQSPQRLRAEAKALLRSQIEEQLEHKLNKIENSSDLRGLLSSHQFAVK